MGKAIAAVICVSLTACLGDIPPDFGGGGDATARDLFDATVYPVLHASCGGCHTTRTDISQFVDPDPANGYARVIGYPAVVGDFVPADAALLTKLAGGHQGVLYSPDQLAAITTWLDREVAERGGVGSGGGGGGVAPALVPLINAWSGCITLGDFRSANMAQAWGNLLAEGQEECRTCHATGGYGHVASDYEPMFFELLTKHSGYLLQYFAPDGSDPAHPVMTVNTFSFHDVSQHVEPHLEHPTFDPATGMVALQSLFDLARARLAANQCGAPTLVD